MRPGQSEDWEVGWGADPRCQEPDLPDLPDAVLDEIEDHCSRAKRLSQQSQAAYDEAEDLRHHMEEALERSGRLDDQAKAAAAAARRVVDLWRDDPDTVKATFAILACRRDPRQALLPLPATVGVAA